MASFEMSAKKLVRLGSMGLTREPKENWPKQYYYSDDNANKAFVLFLAGYSLGKSNIE